jgi:hypothetical protein
VIVVAALGLTACDSGSSTAGTKKHSSTTTRGKSGHSRRTTTTSSSSSSTTKASTGSTTAPPPASTVPPPSSNCGARAGAIYAAVQGGDLGPVPLSKYTIADCRVAASNQIWSAVTLVPNAGSGVVQLTVALQRMGSIWQVDSYGQNRVSCDAPPPVPTELRLGC